MPLDTAATTAALRRATHLRVFGEGSSVMDGFGPLPANLYSVPGTTSLKDPNIRLRAAILRSRNHGKAQVVGQRVMPFVRINAATAVSRHVIGGPSRQTTGTKGNMSRRACGWGGATRTSVAFGSRTSLVRL